jgi:hypothetical protein
MELLFITNEPLIARAAVSAGVRRIFVDLEVDGKSERQKHLNAHLSTHVRADVRKMRSAVPDATLLVRCNPLSDASGQEVEDVLRNGADMVMLPMFYSANEIAHFVRLVDGRAKVVALVETPSALARLRQILAHDHAPDEFYLGLNDLSLLMRLNFLMEPLAGGLVDHFCQEVRKAGIPYGFGGVGTVGSGAVPAELVLSEHVRLGSSRVILSRAFRNTVMGSDTNAVSLDRLVEEVRRVQDTIALLRTKSAAELEENRRALVAAVERVVQERSTTGSDDQ